MRKVAVALAVGAVTVGIATWPAGPGPAASGPGRLGAEEVVPIVHHDQQGVVLAHQAAAQSPAASTRRRATGLARSFQRQARTLTRILDAHAVPVRDRLVDTTRLAAADARAIGCDLMPGDAVSKLAATASAEFDARFRGLMELHLVGGKRMAESVLERGTLTRQEHRRVRSTQARLA